MLPKDEYEDSSGMTTRNYIFLKPSAVENKRVITEETMHFLRNNTVNKLYGVYSEVVEEFFGGLSALLFSNTRKLTDSKYHLSKLSRLFYEALKDENSNAAAEFTKHYLKHPIGYRLAERFFKKKLLDKYPSLFALHPSVIIDVLEKENLFRGL